ncbi:MAG: lactate racemase domain-containing protein, partial [Chloroflexota bacterium]|nr:lactate racemase domain-containing protein [Chloroflexota bacterium]
MSLTTNAKTIRVPQLPWFGDTELELKVPVSWEVIPCLMRGHNLPPLSRDKVREAFLQPIGTPRLRELARDKREVVVIFDDMARPTKVAEMVPFVLEELREGGIEESGIRFVVGLGAHAAMRRFDFVKKLGEEVAQRFPIYNHNPYENCTPLGQTSRGTPVSINSEVMSCDLKIAIGCIVPHPGAGFGGGAKLICP